MVARVILLVVAYLIGSIPTAVLLSRAVLGKDIRYLGDGNMGSRNVAQVMGWRYGLIVFTVDFNKGILAVILARALGFSLEWQLLAAGCAVLGHDFPVFVGFRGGQGLATILGILFIFLPAEFLGALVAFLMVYAFSHHLDLSVGVGIGLLISFALVLKEPPAVIFASVTMVLTIPLKKYVIDRSHRAWVQAQANTYEETQCHLPKV
ncbi:MAG: glycerol-3-phosphate acyltransferase [Thermanaerothrix sp.]|uniref:Glycerol-3-phosphate acyltransferase n=1 Tax=Thermanaerothrix solaris TaxID=3058434 RepID=A0ABU3NR35_9CHLR|nr:glycerol-3-phosphate acyltransferase [Thermanaerothrix sp. 4228-RoL]MDT8899262.1 glycerol-3-phosphate acyltransferase [Thermanaerothrix sp. 4228-RoL]